VHLRARRWTDLSLKATGAPKHFCPVGQSACSQPGPTRHDKPGYDKPAYDKSGYDKSGYDKSVYD
jgi:hypothetical protein